jgi:hypothetical protein
MHQRRFNPSRASISNFISFAILNLVLAFGSWLKDYFVFKQYPNVLLII